MRRALKLVGVTLVVVLGLLTVYGVLVEPRLIMDVRRYAIPIPQVPEGSEGIEVAVLSDLQIGMWFDNPGMVKRIVDRVVAARPAAALVAGDFVYSSDPGVPAQVEEVVELLAPLTEADIPTFAVLGNHDYAVGAAELLTSELEGLGIEVLHNEASVVPGSGALGDAGLYVVGLGAHRPGLTDVSEALADVPDEAPRVVLMHNPASFAALPAHSAPLAVAGHTHCGQIAIPGFPAWSYLELRPNERVVVDGFAPQGHGAEGNRLFVGCGIGFSLVPARIGAPPQVVFFELRGPQPRSRDEGSR